MQNICFRINDELLVELDAYAATRGGRSEVLRCLINSAVTGESALPSSLTKAEISDDAGAYISFSEAEGVLIGSEARAAGMSPREWMKASILSRISPARHFNKYDRTGFSSLLKELRKIQLSLSQILRVFEQLPPIDPGEKRRIYNLGQVAFRLERLEMSVVLGMKGNDSYWKTYEAGMKLDK